MARLRVKSDVEGEKAAGRNGQNSVSKRSITRAWNCSLQHGKIQSGNRANTKLKVTCASARRRWWRFSKAASRQTVAISKVLCNGWLRRRELGGLNVGELT